MKMKTRMTRMKKRRTGIITTYWQGSRTMTMLLSERYLLVGILKAMAFNFQILKTMSTEELRALGSKMMTIERSSN